MRGQFGNEGGQHLRMLGARAGFLAAGLDQRADVLAGLGVGLGQFAHFGGNDGKACALVAGAGGFHRGIERQKVGAKGRVLDRGHECIDLTGEGVDGGDRSAGALGDGGGIMGLARERRARCGHAGRAVTALQKGGIGGFGGGLRRACGHFERCGGLATHVDKPADRDQARLRLGAQPRFHVAFAGQFPQGIGDSADMGRERIV
jgi:hypothetical protein